LEELCEDAQQHLETAVKPAAGVW